MFDNGVVIATTAAASAIILLLYWLKRKGTKDAGRRYPPSPSVLPLVGAILRGGIGVLPGHFMAAAKKIGPVISYNFLGRIITLRYLCEMFDNGVVIATMAAASAIALILYWLKGNRIKDAGRHPPSASVLQLVVAILRGGMIVIPKHLMRTAEKIGPVISYHFLGRQVIFLNGHEAISEAFLRQSEAFSDRLPFWTESTILNPDLRGFASARYNDTFKKRHKLCLNILKDFGFGISSVSENRILLEVESLIQKSLKFDGLPFDPKTLTAMSTFSLTSRILFGETFMKSSSCHRLFEVVFEFGTNTGFLVEFAPVLKFLPNCRRLLSRVIQWQKDTFTGIEEGIQCAMSIDGESSFVKSFKEIQGPGYDHQDLLYIIRDICLGSADSVSSSLMWAVVELANHPEVQTRFQSEVDDVVPNDRLPSLDDKPRLPYTEAVILEVMRRHTLVPFYLPHATLKDTKVLGCTIPKGCTVVANAYSAHMDPSFWRDPQNFRPERFLNKDNIIIGNERVISFGIGKRSCLGEILARQMLFLYLTSFVQRFDIRPPEDQDSIRVDEVVTVGVLPSKFDVRLIPRVNNQGIQK